MTRESGAPGTGWVGIVPDAKALFAVLKEEMRSGDHADEFLQLLDVDRLGKTGDGGNLGTEWENPLRGHMMAQEVYFFYSK